MRLGVVGRQLHSFLALLNCGRIVAPRIQGLSQDQMGRGVGWIVPQVLLIISDGLVELSCLPKGAGKRQARIAEVHIVTKGFPELPDPLVLFALPEQIGRASCRERVSM